MHLRIVLRIRQRVDKNKRRKIKHFEKPLKTDIESNQSNKTKDKR